MNRFFCIVLVLVLLPLFALADPGVVLCYRMVFYSASYNERTPGAFDFDSMSVDVYLMDDFTTAYYMKTTWTDGSVDTTGFVRCALSDGPDSKHTLTFPNGEKMYFYYDDDGEFWLEMQEGAVHMYPCEYFDLMKDLK